MQPIRWSVKCRVPQISCFVDRSNNALLLSWQYLSLVSVMLPHKKSSCVTCWVLGGKGMGFLWPEGRSVVWIHSCSASGSLGCVQWLVGYWIMLSQLERLCSVKWQDGYVDDWKRCEKETAVIHLESFLLHLHEKTTQNLNQLPTEQDSEKKDSQMWSEISNYSA